MKKKRWFWGLGSGSNSESGHCLVLNFLFLFLGYDNIQCHMNMFWGLKENIYWYSLALFCECLQTIKMIHNQYIFLLNIFIKKVKYKGKTSKNVDERKKK